MGQVGVVAIVVVAALSVSACGGNDCVEVIAATPLVEAPYPLDYPSTSPRPNRVLRRLEKGRVDLLERINGKDFMMYRVKLADGSTGYVVADTAVRECTKTGS
jgi:hypothetical protein